MRVLIHCVINVTLNQGNPQKRGNAHVSLIVGDCYNGLPDAEQRHFAQNSNPFANYSTEKLKMG
jgi:hypothetical protein